MENVTIKYEKTINDCESCIFHKWIKGGCDHSMNGIYYRSYCNNIGKYINEHIRIDEYDEDYTLPIPTSCPFKK